MLEQSQADPFFFFFPFPDMFSNKTLFILALAGCNLSLMLLIPSLGDVEMVHINLSFPERLSVSSECSLVKKPQRCSVSELIPKRNET